MPYQVWVGGSDLMDVPQGIAKKDARKWAREWLGIKRLPKDTCVCEISDHYYDDIVRMNQRAGFDASNL